MAELTRRLPVEILASALSYLSDSDLRRTAQVSRRCRTIALAHCGLSIRFYLVFGGSQRRDLSELPAVVTYVCAHGLRFDLVLHCYGILSATQSASLAESLKRALGQLVKLELQFYTDVPDDVYGSLRHPARQLRQLHIMAHDRFSSETMVAKPPPIDLLGCEATSLKSLGLRDVSLPYRVPAFANVQRAKVKYLRTVPHVAIGNVLPSVKDLTIESRCKFIGPASPVFDIRGLALTRLTLEIDGDDRDTNDSILCEIDEQLKACSPAIPVVRRYCASDMWGEAAWDSVTETLSMRVHSNCDWTEAAVVTSVSRLYRMHWFHYSDETEFDMGQPLHELSFLADRLVYVRIQNHFLPGFLEFRCDMTVLRRLQLDLEGFRNMVWPPYHNDICYMFNLDDVDRLSTTFDEGAKDLHLLPCPALAELVITSHERGWTADSRETAHLGLALEQDVRPREERARLELRGVEWEGPVLDELLGLVFSKVVKSSFTGEDPDGSLWDPCFD